MQSNFWESSIDSKRMAQGVKPLITSRNLMYIFATVFVVSLALMVMASIAANAARKQ